MATKVKATGRELTYGGDRSKLKTFAERLRFARVNCGLSQLEFARAITAAAKTKTTKSIVSQWENGHVKMPLHQTLVAIEAVTLFSLPWLVSGTGPERRTFKQNGNGHSPGLSPLIHKAVCVAAAVQKTPEAIAAATVQVFEALRDDPGTPDTALKRIAQLATKTKK